MLGVFVFLNIKVNAFGNYHALHHIGPILLFVWYTTVTILVYSFLIKHIIWHVLLTRCH